MSQAQYQAVGRRKKAIARVRLVPGDGKVVVNRRDIDNYFGLETLKMTVRQPLVLTETVGRFDVLVNVYGGGLSGQTTDIRIHAEHMVYIRDKMNRMLSEYTGQPLEKIQQDTERDNYLTAQQAKEYGLIDEVIAHR